LEEARFQHYALVHAGYSVDLLDEYALESNAFADRGYQVIYLNGPNLPVVAVANLARWVQAGGCLVTTPGAAVADLYNEPNDQMTQFAGIASRQAVRLISPQPLIPVGECVVDDPGVPPLRIPVMTPRVPLELTAATQIAGWGDGGTAIARRGAGTGQVISYGFFPGQQYWITADRDDSLGSPFYFTRLPRGWRKDQRDVVVMPARLAGARRQAVTSHELVEARVLRSPAGVAVTLLNWTDAPIPGFSVSLPDVTEWTRVSTATGVPVTAREEGGLRTFDLPLGAVDVLMLERP
jgi:hypothetical protein